MFQDCKILSDARFIELCAVVGVTKQCSFAPDKKLIEKSFRKKALKCHPDKGGDPVVFKKLNDAYNKLIGHVRKVTTFLTPFYHCLTLPYLKT